MTQSQTPGCVTCFITQQEIHDIQYQEAPPQDFKIRQYSQGPQGDPFAPQLPPPFFPLERQLLPTPKPKRKHRIRREEGCSFCQGNGTRNTMGDPELMLTFHLCGRSGLSSSTFRRYIRYSIILVRAPKLYALRRETS